MSLGGWIQKQATSLLFMNKEKLIALALERLAKEYQNNRLMIAQKVVEKLPQSWHDTATQEETAHLIDVLKKAIEDIYVAIQAMRSLPTREPVARTQSRI